MLSSVYLRVLFGFMMPTEKKTTFLKSSGRKPACFHPSGIQPVASTVTNTLLSRAGGRPPLLHGCSERRHPSRDQRTPVNPLLKILANPLGLLRVASGHCACHKSGIRQWKAVNGASTPDPPSRHVSARGKGARNCASPGDLRHMSRARF